MSQKWKMCLVSERGQTRAWIFITCTATRWRRPIHQAELSCWSQTFPIKTTPPQPLHAPSHCCCCCCLRCESRRSIHMGGEEREWKRAEGFWTLRPARPVLADVPRLQLFHNFSRVYRIPWTEPALFCFVFFLPITNINIKGCWCSQWCGWSHRAREEGVQPGSLGRY